MLLAVLSLLTLGSLAHCATITWTNTSGGNWSVASNWSPNQVPTNTDNVLITNAGTYTVNLDVSGVATNLTLGAGGGAAGVQTFVATNLLTVNSLLLVTGGGVLNSSGDYAGLAGAMTVANGGVFNLAAGYYHFDSALNPLVVTNGGTVNANGQPLLGSGFGYYFGFTFGSVTVANGGLLNVTNGAQAGGACNVTPGGVLNVSAAGLTSYGPVNNSGIINLTNGTIGLINNVYNGGTGGLFNQPGGLINFQGSGSISSSSGLPGYEQNYYGYVTNQGTITQITGTNTIYCPFYDNSQGTITNLSGVLSLGLFQTNLAGTYFTAAGATVQFMGADIPNYNAAPQLTLGTPFVLGGGGKYQLTSGYLYLPANVPPPNLALMGDTLQLGPGFQGGAITNLTLEGIQLLNALPVTGMLTASNCEIATNLVVANGGVFNLNNVFVKGSTTVTHGGTINVQGGFPLLYSLTNAGTLNLTAPIVYNGPATGILNQPGGLINLGSNASITIATPTNYFINQGTVVQNAGADATNTISYQKIALVYFATNLSDEISIYLPFNFDTSQGTITNLSGTLVLPGFPSSLAGVFDAAAGATIQLGGGTTNAPLVPGTPLVLGGSGQYQFISGYLYLPANAIPNLSLQAGLLTLGAGFQGGAITNLVLDGITLSNQSPVTLPINGTFTAMNSGSAGTLNNGAYVGFYGSGVHGNYSVAGGGVLNVSNAIMYGTVMVANGGVLNAASSSILYGNLTVAGGGVLNSSFNATFYVVTVASNGLFNSLDSFFPYVGRFGPSSSINGLLTNFGTINMTNSGLGFFNDGTTNLQGCLINQAGGLIDFWGDTAIGGGPYAYIVNQGRIIKSAGTGLSGFNITSATNSGTITAQTGTMVLGTFQQLTLLPSGSLNVGLNSATNYGSFIISSSGPFNVTGNAALAGTFNATLNNGYVPTNGTTFNVLSYGSFTGSFSSLGLPAAVSWQSTYGSTNFFLVAGSAQPQFGTVNLSGTNLIFNGMGGTAGSNYVILASTNLTIPLTNWLALTTNTFDGSGQFHYTKNVNPAKPRQFFIFKLP